MIVYVTGQLGTITNSFNTTVNYQSTPLESYTITSTLTTTRAYTDISLNALSDISGNQVFSITSNCTSNESGSITNLNCMLNQTNNTGSAIYTVNSVFVYESDIPINIYYNAPGYTINSNNQAFVLNTINLQNTLIKLPVSITITPQNLTLNQESSKQFNLVGVYKDGTTINLPNSVTWSSSNPAVATINSSGLAIGVSDGSTTITATSGSISASTTFTFVGNLYLADYSNNLIYYVTLTSTGAKIGESTFATGFSYPSNIATYKNYMYISNRIDNKIRYCSWNSATGKIESCAYTGTNTHSGYYMIATNNGYLYYTKSNSGVFNIVYSLINADGSLGESKLVNGPLAGTFNRIVFYKNYVYITGYSPIGLQYCSVTNESNFSNCQDVTNSTGGLVTAMGITIYNGYIYMSGFDVNTNIIFRYCSINSNGSLTNCNNVSNINYLVQDMIAKKNMLYYSGVGGIYYCTIFSNGSVSTCSNLSGTYGTIFGMY
jgi:hypothetical protein